MELVKLLLKSGALIDAQDKLQGNTPLHEAAWKGFRQTAEVLMKHKANPHIKNKGGFSALHLACQNGHNGTTRVLLMSKCKPDLKNDYGDTPLHTACRYGHAGVARILISAFCDVNQVNKNGDTALHITAGLLQTRFFSHVSSLSRIISPRSSLSLSLSLPTSRPSPVLCTCCIISLCPGRECGDTFARLLAPLISMVSLIPLLSVCVPDPPFAF